MSSYFYEDGGRPSMDTPSPDKRPTVGFQIPVTRNIVEFGAIIAWWLCIFWLVTQFQFVGIWASLIVIIGCWVKSLYFGIENLNQLYDAARSDLSHHQFLILMATTTIYKRITRLYLTTEYAEYTEGEHGAGEMRDCPRGFSSYGLMIVE
ncbi:MAG: hypothetical protein NTV29_12435 [Planctomycetota bacterium]|nr:hypothetical protein [Planctomycetota bacterium]